jgi:hypothetical protein
LHGLPAKFIPAEPSFRRFEEHDETTKTKKTIWSHVVSVLIEEQNLRPDACQISLSVKIFSCRGYRLMSSFFNSIRNYFDAKYDGRYFSVLLRELAQNEPESFSSIIDDIAENHRLPIWNKISVEIRDRNLDAKCEHHFPGRKKRRRADLAFLRAKTPVVLMEVKEFDHLNPENLRQVLDYLNQVSAELAFVYIYRFLPERDVYNAILREQRRGRPVALVSYDKIYLALKNSTDQNRPLAILVCSYLEDIGVGVYRDIDVKRKNGGAAKFLLAQMLGFPGAAGMGKLQSDAAVRAGPELVKALLGNIEVVGEWIRAANEKNTPQHFSRRFWIDPQFNYKKLRKALRACGDENDRLPDGMWSYVEGGTAYFVSTGAIRTRTKKKGQDRRLVIEVGFGLELEKGNKSIRPYVYCQFSSFGYGKALDLSRDSTYCDSDYLRSFPSQDAALRAFNGVLKKSLNKALRKASAPVAAGLRQFHVPRIEPGS